jgi:hypothetical protein
MHVVVPRKLFFSLLSKNSTTIPKKDTSTLCFCDLEAGEIYFFGERLDGGYSRQRKNGEITVIYQHQSRNLKCWPATKGSDVCFGQQMFCSMGGLYQQEYSSTYNIPLYTQVICKRCYIHISFTKADKTVVTSLISLLGP